MPSEQSGGYTGQLVALDVNQFSLGNELTSLAKLQQEQEAVKADEPQARADEARARTTQLDAQTPGIQAESRIKQLGADNAEIADVWSHIDPDSPDATAQMHAGMQRLADRGVTQAKQFLNIPYSQQKADEISRSFGGPAAGEAAGAIAGAVPPASADQIKSWDAQFGTASPQQLNQYVAAHQKFAAALEQIAAAPDEATRHKLWDQYATQFGLGQYAGRYSQLRVRGMITEQEQLGTYLQNRVMSAAGGAPLPAPPHEVKEVGGGLYNVTEGPGGPTAKTVVARPPQFVATDPSGHGVYTTSGVSGNVVEQPGKIVLGPKPGTMGASGNAYMLRYQLYKAVNANDPQVEQKALAYARLGPGAPGIRPIGPGQIQVYAANQARADWNAKVNSGQVPPGVDGEAWIQQRAQNYYVPLITQAQNDLSDVPGAGAPLAGGAPGGAPAAPAAGGAPAPAPAAGAGGWGGPTPRSAIGSQTPAQHAVAKQIVAAGVSGPEGSIGNPVVPVNDNQLQRLRTGAYFIAPDGTIRQKTW